MNDPVYAPDRCCVCGKPITQPAAQGRPRRHCSAACRARAQRAIRARTEAILGIAVGGLPLEERMRQALGELSEAAFDLPPDPDDAVLHAVAQAWLLTETLERAAAAARPDLADRCGRAAAALRAALSS